MNLKKNGGRILEGWKEEKEGRNVVTEIQSENQQKYIHELEELFFQSCARNFRIMDLYLSP